MIDTSISNFSIRLFILISIASNIVGSRSIAEASNLLRKPMDFGPGSGFEIDRWQPTSQFGINSRSFITDVIEKISESVPSRVNIYEEGDGLIIRHTCFHKGKQVDFSYRIEFKGSEVHTPEKASLTDTNIISIPNGPWDGDMLIAIQNAWRRMTIADPVLYARFTRKIASPEPYQAEAIDALVNSAQANGHGLAVMATASGKTFVAFKTKVRLLEEYLTKVGKEAGAVLFLVNNTVILREAEQKLHEYFPGRFKTGRIYGGEEEAEEESYSTDTDVIFATTASFIPSTASEKSRLEKLLSTRKIAIVIVDEVHHLPAATHRMIFNRIREENEETRFIGLTATEVRPDNASVISFFGNIISFEYPMTRGWEEGYLTPMVYLAGDDDILRSVSKKPDEIGAIQTGTVLESEYKKAIYSDTRFPHLLKVYTDITRDNPSARVLFLCPFIERAQALVSFFQANGVEEAISLTSAEKQADDRLYWDSYTAFKEGEWPAGSPYKDNPIPTAVMAVDVFREGIDVPAIDAVVLWADTDSTIRYVQGIGRGLRPAPFKTHLTVVDTVGLYRKAHILRYLGELIVKNRDKGTNKPLSQEEVRDTDFAAKILHTGPVTQGLSLSHDVSFVLKSFFEDVPSRLDHRYGAYPLIPVNEYKSLDTFIASRAGFQDNGRPSIEKLLEYIKGAASMLGQKPDEATLLSIREKLTSTFYISGIFEEGDSNEIPVFGTTKIVFSRIEALFLRYNPELTSKDIYTIFPEFDPKRGDILRTRAANLKLLRSMVFSRGYETMARELIRDYWSQNKRPVNYTNPYDTWITSENGLLQSRDLEILGLRLAEGCREKPVDRDAARINLGRKDQAMAATVAVNNEQGQVIDIYLGHTMIKGRLQRSDFDLGKEEFARLLLEKGLIETTKSHLIFFRALEKAITVYSGAILGQDSEKIDAARKALKGLFEYVGDNVLLDREGITDRRLDKIQGLYQKLGQIHAAARDKGFFKEEDTEIERHFRDLLENIGIQKIFEPSDLKGVRILVQKLHGELNYCIKVEIEGLSYKPVLYASIRSDRDDGFGRPHVFIIDTADRGLRPNIVDFYLFYQDLSKGKQFAFIDEIKRAIEYIGTMAGANNEDDVVYIVPEDRPEHVKGNRSAMFFLDLLDAMADSEAGVSGFVFGPVSNVTTTPGRKSGLSFTPEATVRSRLPALPAQDINYYSKLCSDMRNREYVTYREKLASIYLQWHACVTNFPKWPEILRKLSQDPSDTIAYKLKYRLIWTMANFPHDDYYLGQIRIAYDMLNTPELSKHQIYTAYLKNVTAWRSDTNILRMPIAKMVKEYRLLLHAINQSTSPLSEAVNSALLEYTEFVGDVANRYIDSMDAGDAKEWLANTEWVRDGAENWSERLNELREQYYPTFSEPIEEEEAAKVALPAHKRTEEVSIAFAGDCVVLFITGYEKKQGDIGVRKVKARKRTATTQGPVVHISPECPEVKSSGNPHVFVLRRLWDNLAERYGGSITWCGHCPHGMESYPLNTPAWATGLSGDIVRYYREKGKDIGPILDKAEFTDQIWSNGEKLDLSIILPQHTLEPVQDMDPDTVEREITPASGFKQELNSNTEVRQAI